MLDTCHCAMNSDHFEDEYEFFYDFSGTYEEGFIGKTIDDFDLTEEPLAKPMSAEIINFEKADEEDGDATKVDFNSNFGSTFIIGTLTARH